MKRLICASVLLLVSCSLSYAAPSFFVSSDYNQVGLGSIDPVTGGTSRIDSDTSSTFYDVARFDNNHLVAAKPNTINIYNLSGSLVNQFTDVDNPRAVTTYNGEVYYVTNNGKVKKLNVDTGVITYLGYNVGTSSAYNAIYDIAVRSESEIFVRKNGYQIIQAGGGYIHNSNIYSDIYDLVSGPDGYLFFASSTRIGVVDPDNNVSIGLEVDISQADPYIALQGISYDEESGSLYGLGFYYESSPAYFGYYIFQFDFDQGSETLSMTSIAPYIEDDEFASVVYELAVHYELPEQVIPEPATLVLLGIGIAGLMKRKTRR